MTKKDLKRYSTIQDCIDGIYTVPQAAKILGLSDRQVQRIKKEVLENGPKGVIHKGRGKISNKAIHPKTIDKIVELKKSIFMKKLISLTLRNYLKKKKTLLSLILAYTLI